MEMEMGRNGDRTGSSYMAVMSGTVIVTLGCVLGRANIYRFYSWDLSCICLIEGILIYYTRQDKGAPKVKASCACKSLTTSFTLYP